MAGASYLVIGHITLDTADGGFTLGGTATYSAVTAARLGLDVRVLTACARHERQALASLCAAGPVVDIALVDSGTTTRFTNTYLNGSRLQHVLSVAAPIGPADLPRGWCDHDIVHLGPVAAEVDPALMRLFANGATLGVTPQGWLRSWDAAGLVRPTAWTPDPDWLRAASALVLSEDDVGRDAGTSHTQDAQDTDLIDYYAEHCPVVVVTRGYRGCLLRTGGESLPLLARPAAEVDPTGAGDVFAAAFFIRLRETGDPLQAARFANVVGSMSVQGPGTSAIPTRQEVESWLSRHPEY